VAAGTRWRPALWALIVVVAWLLVGGAAGGFQGRLAEVQNNDAETYLPADAEATRAGELSERFGEEGVVPALVVYERDGGLTDADRAHMAAVTSRLAGLPGVARPPSEPVPAPDQAAANQSLAVVEDDVTEAVARVREAARDGAPDGLRVHVTGPAGFVADLGEAFGEIDGMLLVVTASAVAVILILVYRSPLLPLLVLIGAGLALGTASAVVYALTDAGLLVLNGQSQGIMLILVFGAATDYALLLVARYREELAARPDRFAAMAVAWRRSVGPILASGSTVILAVLALLLSELNSNRSLGPVAAVGIAAALLVMLTYLPAVLALLGRVAFWPFAPRDVPRADGDRRGWWSRLAATVGRRDRPVWVVTALVLVVFAALMTQLRADGVPQSELFLADVDSVAGQEALARHFPAGSASPTVIVANADRVDAVAAAASSVSGVAQVQPAGQVGDLAQVVAVLDAPADSDEAIGTVQRVRDAVHAVPGADALVGGPTAVNLDTREAASRDQRVIIPVTLLVVFLVVALLLRALLVPALLLASVVLSYAATMGLAAVVFNHVFHFPGADPAVPLFAFVFLVALGVDYTIFLMSRVREEAARVGTREGIRIGLAVTGGVITSAGIVLAATFSALAVLPLLFLVQTAFIVATGVLIDTFVVRSLLVPALCHDIGRTIWWPSRLSRRPQPS
jgi:RND superfamily putative drug exporter